MSMKRFDPAQRKAIRHFKGPMLVLAGPGSGKTTVLTNRIRCLNTQYGIPEKEMLVLTFTRAAASEMKERYLKLKSSVHTEVMFGTFHSVIYHFLESISQFQGFQICEREDALRMTGNVLCAMYGSAFCPGTVCEEVYDQIGRLKNGLKVSAKLPLQVYPELERVMKDKKYIDYDDLLLMFLHILTDDPGLLLELRKRYRYILVDEFQDLNRTQYDILKLLSGPEKNIFAVGDDDQSIYGFRGSDPEYMNRFLKDFCPAEKVCLSANHRSTSEIVKASTRLIRHNRVRFRKRLHSVNGRGLRPEYREFENSEEEAKYIEEKIALIRGTARKEGLIEPTFAVLGRTGAVLKDIRKYLNPHLASEISILTFHGSKGLEFDGVFIIGVNDGITPDSRAVRENTVEEERRAFYVAMTRAAKYLHIFNTKTLYNKPVKSSAFIREVFSFI